MYESNLALRLDEIASTDAPETTEPIARDSTRLHLVDTGPALPRKARRRSRVFRLEFSDPGFRPYRNF